MRNGQNQNKRMRGRNRKNHNPLTRVYESNGPDVKVRGTANHIAEKYLQLARDAQSSGDPVASESYFQHAEHYFRLIASIQEQYRQQNPFYRPEGEGRDEGSDDGDYDGDGPSMGNDPSYNPPRDANYGEGGGSREQHGRDGYGGREQHSGRDQHGGREHRNRDHYRDQQGGREPREHRGEQGGGREYRGEHGGQREHRGDRDQQGGREPREPRGEQGGRRESYGERAPQSFAPPQGSAPEGGEESGLAGQLPSFITGGQPQGFPQGANGQNGFEGQGERFPLHRRRRRRHSPRDGEAEAGGSEGGDDAAPVPSPVE